MRHALTNCTLYTGTAVLPQHALLLRDERIEAVLPSTDLPADIPRTDAHGLNVAPGLIDLQIYGGGGMLFSVEPTVEVLARLQQAILRQGTTRFLATMPTNSPAMMRAALEAANAFRQQSPYGLLGIHLEGPYINPIKKGAHQAEFIKAPTTSEVTDLLNLSQGALRIMTMAPEVATPEVVQLLREAGVVLSAGHSDATYAQATAGFRQGFTAATHLFNAMSPLGSREPGMVGAVYDAESAHASIIADGQHCDFAAIRISKKIMGERLFLITDAVEESTQGAYRFRRNGERFVDELGTLAGSALTLMQAVQNCVQHVGLPLAESLRMATLYPARVIHQDHELGLLQAHYLADLCLFDDAFAVKGTMLQGDLQWH
ncbi:N-acetylglucosamine-6-phosphate deacetylase [Hymenobacter jejuensis]|nr:N-acetylglucosamine-6-phosphate deacetylase [Hymenobacter jejuensis]